MNLPLFIARKIYSDQGDKRKVSRPAIRIATIGVAIGLAVMIVTVSVVLGFKHTIRDKVVGFGSHIQVHHVLSYNGSTPHSICTDDSLLKAISGIMFPTEGTLEVEGQVAALLELGSGFDAEMTVRENTFLRGALLGYTKAFIQEKYDEIIAFAELEDFQDYAFRQLSSGMKSRLAFSIACLVKPDILILDEVLSVGDGAFRKKSGDKMKEVLSGGVTGILVSHSTDQVKELCSKVLWLDHGRQVYFGGRTAEVLDLYDGFLKTKKLPDAKLFPAE